LGLGIRCGGEWFAAAANWAEAAAPVYFLGDRGQWLRSHWRVADFRHSPLEALERHVAEMLILSGEDPEEAEALTSEAETIDPEEQP
jgi:hypothetical protein